jgi:hypothetical protein
MVPTIWLVCTLALAQSIAFSWRDVFFSAIAFVIFYSLSLVRFIRIPSTRRRNQRFLLPVSKHVLRQQLRLRRFTFTRKSWFLLFAGHHLKTWTVRGIFALACLYIPLSATCSLIRTLLFATAVWLPTIQKSRRRTRLPGSLFQCHLCYTNAANSRGFAFLPIFHSRRRRHPLFAAWYNSIWTKSFSSSNIVLACLQRLTACYNTWDALRPVRLFVSAFFCLDDAEEVSDNRPPAEKYVLCGYIQRFICCSKCRSRRCLAVAPSLVPQLSSGAVLHEGADPRCSDGPVQPTAASARRKTLNSDRSATLLARSRRLELLSLQTVLYRNYKYGVYRAKSSAPCVCEQLETDRTVFVHLPDMPVISLTVTESCTVSCILRRLNIDANWTVNDGGGRRTGTSSLPPDSSLYLAPPGFALRGGGKEPLLETRESNSNSSMEGIGYFHRSFVYFLFVVSIEKESKADGGYRKLSILPVYTCSFVTVDGRGINEEPQLSLPMDHCTLLFLCLCLKPIV